MRDKPVTESIDERILRLLQLEDVFDLDYETYKNLLGELVISSTLGKSELSREEELLIQQEFKRIRKKTGRFKPKKKKITSKNVGTTKITGQKLLPAGKLGGLTTVFTSTILSIQKSVESISKNLGEQNKILEKNSETERKRAETEKRDKREEKLETGAKKIAAVAKKLFTPVQGILDKIFNFLFYTLLGRVSTSTFEWFADPKNADKVAALGRFLKDWWPALLGAYFMPFKGFVFNILKTIAGFSAKFLLTNPVGLSITGSATAGIAGAYAESQFRSVDERLLQRRIEESKSKGKELSKDEIERIRTENLQRRIDSVTGRNIPGSALSSGGLINSSTGIRITGAGSDTQLTALQPGEVVMNRAAVRGVGLDKLLALNARFGGSNANKPKFAGNIQFAQGGGLIGALGKVLPGTGTVMAPRSSGPKDIRGVRQTQAGYQNKFLGMNVGNTFFPKGSSGEYSQQENRRYYERTGKYFIPTDFGSRYLPGMHGLYTPPKQQTPQTQTRASTGLDPFRNFGSNVKTIQGAAKKQEEMMRQMGHKPSGYVNLFGQPVKGSSDALGPQSRALPPTPPTGKGRTTIINLPPTYETASAGMKGSAKGTEIPSFSAIAPGNHRQKQSEVYGLVG